MREKIESAADGHEIYGTRREKYKTKEKVPFRVSPNPLELSVKQKREIETIGREVVEYFNFVDELRRTDSEVREILSSGKPEIFLIDRPMRYLFVRPDIIITDEGFKICEIETSPFGLALAELLNKAYREEGFETMVADQTLPDLVQANTPTEGRIIYSSKTEAYAGQMTFLAEKVFSGDGRDWKAEKASKVFSNASESIYRGFYLNEYLEDPAVSSLLEGQISKAGFLIPSATPQMEEKAILSFLWDRRFEERLRKRLGESTFIHLRQVVPPTWIVGQERHFSPGMPANVSTSAGLAMLSRSKRAFVLKPSGFGGKGSWAEGVSFLHKKSAIEASHLLQEAKQDRVSLHIVQQFTKGKNVRMQYNDAESGELVPMSARVRLTPYFSMVSGQEGDLVAIKATACENTDLIHGSSSSINTAVG